VKRSEPSDVGFNRRLLGLFAPGLAPRQDILRYSLYRASQKFIKTIKCEQN
jgi:hypothetical protein